MRRFLATALIAALGLLLASIGPGAAARPNPTTHTVTIEGARFEPAVVTVSTGESIVWVNKDPYPHTVTSTTGEFDSHEIQPDRTWTYTARKPGEFPYVCTFHPTMQGTLRVKQDSR